MFQMLMTYHINFFNLRTKAGKENPPYYTYNNNVSNSCDM